jgi:methylated-DNA-[protein]-cysteine S-methyltransferase
MRRRFPGAAEAVAPDEVQVAIDSIVALMRGEARDLCEIVLDMDGVQPFNRRVYEIARTIPPGSTLSYGDVAKRLGEPRAAREVGQALGNNPFPPIVPCHRVLAGDGTMHGFSAPGGVATKLRLLTIEGWRSDEPTLFDVTTG